MSASLRGTVRRRMLKLQKMSMQVLFILILGMEELKKKMDEKKLKQKASPIPKPKDDGAWVKAE